MKDHHNDRWFKYADLTSEANIPMIVPIPAIYASDGFDTDIDAADLYERLDAIPELKQQQLRQSLQLLRKFLTAVVVNYNKKDPTIIPPLTTFMTQQSALINKWKMNRLHALFPSLQEQANATQEVKTTPEITKDATDTPNTWSPEAFLQAFAAFKTDTMTNNTPVDTTKDTASSETLGMGTYAYHPKRILRNTVVGA
jgi:hypothetical protein